MLRSWPRGRIADLGRANRGFDDALAAGVVVPALRDVALALHLLSIFVKYFLMVFAAVLERQPLPVVVDHRERRFGSRRLVMVHARWPRLVALQAAKLSAHAFFDFLACG